MAERFFLRGRLATFHQPRRRNDQSSRHVRLLASDAPGVQETGRTAARRDSNSTEKLSLCRHDVGQRGRELNRALNVGSSYVRCSM